MPNEEMDKQIEFMKEHLAHITAKLDEVATIQAQSEVRLAKVEESFVVLVELAKMTDSRLDTLTQNVNALTGKLDTLTDKVTALTDAQKNTDERLNTLINVVERHISEGHNGRPQA